MVQKSLKAKWISLKIKHGKKQAYEKKLLTSLKLFQKNNKKNFNVLFKRSLKEVTPLVQLRKVTRNTDDTYKEYPYVLEENKRIKLGLRNLAKNPCITDNISIPLWIKNLTEKASTTNKLQIQTLQLKRLLKYRWFI